MGASNLLGLKDRVQFPFYPRTETKAKGVRLAKKRGMSLSRLIEEALEEKIERELPHAPSPKSR